MLMASTALNFEIAFVDPEIVAVSAGDFPKAIVPKLGSEYSVQVFTVGQELGASAIHSAEFLSAPAFAPVIEKDLPVVTSLIDSVNFEVVVEYVTEAENTFPGLMVN